MTDWSISFRKRGGYVVTPEEKKKLQAVMWDREGHRTIETIASEAPGR